MFLKIDHIGIVAPSWEEAQPILLDHLGLTVDLERSPLPEGGYFAPERTRIYFVRIGASATRIEVLIPTDTTSGTARYMAKHGPGLHHIAYACADVAEEVRRLRERGLREIDLGPVDDPNWRGAAFFHPKLLGGILTELVHDRP